MLDIGGAQFLCVPSCVPVFKWQLWPRASWQRPSTTLHTQSLGIMAASLWQYYSRSYCVSALPISTSPGTEFWGRLKYGRSSSFLSSEVGGRNSTIQDWPLVSPGCINSGTLRWSWGSHTNLCPWIASVGGDFIETQSICPTDTVPSLHQKAWWNDGGKIAFSSDWPLWPTRPSLPIGLQSQQVRIPGSLCYQTPLTTSSSLKGLQSLAHWRLFSIGLISKSKPSPWAPWPSSSWSWYPSSLRFQYREK